MYYIYALYGIVGFLKCLDGSLHETSSYNPIRTSSNRDFRTFGLPFWPSAGWIAREIWLDSKHLLLLLGKSAALGWWHRDRYLWMGIITTLIGCNQGEPDLSPRPHRLVKAVVLVCHLVSEAGWIPVSVGQVPMSIDDIYTHLYWSKIIQKISIYLHM